MVPETGALKTDQEYLEEYFNICALLLEKRHLLDKLKDKKELKEEEAKRLKEELAMLNPKIKEKDSFFWVKVEKSLGEGKKFVIEEIASHYSLDIFEKQILLFFLYLEFFRTSENLCSKSDFLDIFDLDYSVLSRMYSSRHFMNNSTLIKQHLITADSWRDRTSHTIEYELNSKTFGIFLKMLNGEKIDWEKEGEEEPVSSCEDIGYVKTPEYSLQDVILKGELKEKVLFFLAAFHGKKLEELQVSQRIKKGKGVTFLFYGPPGTGKSMLAEAIASYLNKKILIVEFPKITSRWFGETDNNISKIFKTARENDMVICMDEADSLLYNRSYAAQEHDIRFVNVMLQEIERFEGVAVFTTNMDILLDQALERRVSLKIKFEAPDEKLRVEIWKSHIPNTIKLADDVDFRRLAKRYDFAGGYIKNAVLNAIRRIANKKQDTLTMEDFIFGADMEKEGMFYNNKEKRIIGFAEGF